MCCIHIYRFRAGLAVSSHMQLKVLIRIETFGAPATGEDETRLLRMTAHVLLEENFPETNICNKTCQNREKV